MEESKFEITFARPWLRFYFGLGVLALLLVIFLGILFWNENREPYVFLLSIPILISLVIYYKRINTKGPRLILSETGVHMMNNFHPDEFNGAQSPNLVDNKIHVPWEIIISTVVISSRGLNLVTLITTEDEAWELTRAILPMSRKNAVRKYVIHASSLQLSAEQIGSIINRLASVATFERNALLISLPTQFL